MRPRNGRRCCSLGKRLLSGMDFIFKFQRVSDRSMHGIYAVKLPSGIECGCDHCVAHPRTDFAGNGVRVFGCLMHDKLRKRWAYHSFTS